MLGTVAKLRRYPVKSMLGEDLSAGDVTLAGLAGDRRLAVISRRTGKIASAKYPRLWRALLTRSARSLPGLRNEPVTLSATPPPGASLDRAVPEAVLRGGINAEVAFEVNEIGGGGPPGAFVGFPPLRLRP